METVKVNTSQHIDIDYPVAGLGERISARLIDLGIFFALYICLIIIVVTIGRGSNTLIWVMVITIGVSYVFYNLVCEIFMTGQSVGKRLMKIKVISLDGSQPTLGQYFIRWLFRLVDFVITGQVGGLICIALSENKQRIGDLVAGTTVIKTVARTQFDHIVFHPTQEEGYVPVFQNAALLSDRDMELIHEVITTFYKTAQFNLIQTMSAKVAGVLSVELPKYGKEMDFLNTVIKDYNHITSASA